MSNARRQVHTDLRMRHITDATVARTLVLESLAIVWRDMLKS